MNKLIVIALVCGLAGCGTRSSLDDATVVDNDSGAVSTCLFNVTRHASDGWLLTEPEAHLMFWGNWNDSQTTIQPGNFQYEWSLLMGSDAILQRLSEYGIHEGTLDPNNYFDTGPTAYVDDAGLSTEDGGVAELVDSTFVSTINSEIQYGILPYPNNNTLYVIMLPPGLSTQSMINNHWGGYHNHGSYGAQQYAYAIIGYWGDPGTNVTLSHELYEASSNPGGVGYYDTKTGMEIADLCETAGSESIGNFPVSKVWSQVLCQCQ